MPERCPFIGCENNCKAKQPTLSVWFREESFNSLSPNIHIQILQTGLNIFPYRIRGDNLLKDQSISLKLSFY